HAPDQGGSFAGLHGSDRSGNVRPAGTAAIQIVHGERRAVGFDARYAQACHRSSKDVRWLLTDECQKAFIDCHIMLVALIGYRGSGKTAVAQLAALRLGWDWIDADVEIELRAGKSIATIFADDGESAFRDLETRVLSELLKRERTLLALG